MILSPDIRADFLAIHRIYGEFKGREKELIHGSIAPVIVSIKRRIRNTLKEQGRTRTENEYDWHYNYYCDSRWCKIVYDGLPDDETEVEEYKRDTWWHWYNPYNDGIDCTGVWFTRSIYVFPLTKLNKTIVYHFQDCDV